MPAKSRITPLLIAAPVMVLVGALVTALAWLNDAFSQYNEPSATAAQYGVGFVIGAGGAIALLVVSLRSAPARLRRAGVITGAILAGLAVLVSGLPLAASVAAVVRIAVLSAQPLTDREQSSSTELRAQSAKLFENIGLNDGETLRSRQICSLTNLDRGEKQSTLEVFHLAAESKDSAIDTIQTRWESLGYSVLRTDDQLSITGQGLVESASVSWYGEAGTLAIDVLSICVAKP